ncbi:MAG: hypothetical protein ACLFQ8_02460 [Candidatus Aenigmatarchaeota archaeon]
MYSDTPEDEVVVKADVDGVLTDIKETFENCIPGSVLDYVVEKEYDLEDLGYEFAEEVCETTNLAYKENRDLLVPREEDLPGKIEGIKEALEKKTGKHAKFVIATSRKGIDEEELEEALSSMGIENYDDLRIEEEKHKDCDILIEDNPGQIKAFFDEGGQKAYHINNECSKMVYREQEDIYGDGRCRSIESFSEIIEDVEAEEPFDESFFDQELAKPKAC